MLLLGCCWSCQPGGVLLRFEELPKLEFPGECEDLLASWRACQIKCFDKHFGFHFFLLILQIAHVSTNFKSSSIFRSSPVSETVIPGLCGPQHPTVT